MDLLLKIGEKALKEVEAEEELQQSQQDEDPDDVDEWNSDEEMDLTVDDEQDDPSLTPSRRPVRPMERQQLRPWLVNQIDNGEVDGLYWIDSKKMIFRIPWKHGSRGGWKPEQDASLFMRWAQHTGRYHEDGTDQTPNFKRWKANFRCALNSRPDIVEEKDLTRKKGTDAFRVYRFLPLPGKDKKAYVNQYFKAKGIRSSYEKSPDVLVVDRSLEAAMALADMAGIGKRETPSLPVSQQSSDVSQTCDSGVEVKTEALSPTQDISQSPGSVNVQKVLPCLASALSSKPWDANKTTALSAVAEYGQKVKQDTSKQTNSNKRPSTSASDSNEPEIKRQASEQIVSAAPSSTVGLMTQVGNEKTITLTCDFPAYAAVDTSKIDPEKLKTMIKTQPLAQRVPGVGPTQRRVIVASPQYPTGQAAFLSPIKEGVAIESYTIQQQMQHLQQQQQQQQQQLKTAPRPQSTNVSQNQTDAAMVTTQIKEEVPHAGYPEEKTPLDKEGAKKNRNAAPLIHAGLLSGGGMQSANNARGRDLKDDGENETANVDNTTSVPPINADGHRMTVKDKIRQKLQRNPSQCDSEVGDESKHTPRALSPNISASYKIETSYPSAGLDLSAETLAKSTSTINQVSQIMKTPTMQLTSAAAKGQKKSRFGWPQKKPKVSVAPTSNPTRQPLQISLSLPQQLTSGGNQQSPLPSLNKVGIAQGFQSAAKVNVPSSQITIPSSQLNASLAQGSVIGAQLNMPVTHKGLVGTQLAVPATQANLLISPIADKTPVIGSAQLTVSTVSGAQLAVPISQTGFISSLPLPAQKAVLNAQISMPDQNNIAFAPQQQKALLRGATGEKYVHTSKLAAGTRIGLVDASSQRNETLVKRSEAASEITANSGRFVSTLIGQPLPLLPGTSPTNNVGTFLALKNAASIGSAGLLTVQGDNASSGPNVVALANLPTSRPEQQFVPVQLLAQSQSASGLAPAAKTVSTHQPASTLTTLSSAASTAKKKAPRPLLMKNAASKQTPITQQIQLSSADGTNLVSLPMGALQSIAPINPAIADHQMQKANPSMPSALQTKEAAKATVYIVPSTQSLQSKLMQMPIMLKPSTTTTTGVNPPTTDSLQQVSASEGAAGHKQHETKKRPNAIKGINYPLHIVDSKGERLTDSRFGIFAHQTILKGTAIKQISDVNRVCKSTQKELLNHLTIMENSLEKLIGINEGTIEGKLTKSKVLNEHVDAMKKSIRFAYGLIFHGMSRLSDTVNSVHDLSDYNVEELMKNENNSQLQENHSSHIAVLSSMESADAGSATSDEDSDAVNSRIVEAGATIANDPNLQNMKITQELPDTIFSTDGNNHEMRRQDIAQNSANTLEQDLHNALLGITGAVTSLTPLDTNSLPRDTTVLSQTTPCTTQETYVTLNNLLVSSPALASKSLNDANETLNENGTCKNGEVVIPMTEGNVVAVTLQEPMFLESSSALESTSPVLSEH